MKLQTKVEFPKSRVRLSLNDRITVLGSCFADNIGEMMSHCGFKVCVNPFGTLYNPVSLANSIARLRSGICFEEKDCVEMGAGAGLVCSFSHHTSFARKSKEEFLENANAALEQACGFWEESNKVIITLGTSWCFRHGEETVANCLKRPAAEFERYCLDCSTVRSILESIVLSNPDKEFIFTVSPIRHLADGAHGNQISKSTLLMACDSVSRHPHCDYFPAYEILMDELRDYRFYAEDMVHPSSQTIGYIWERFQDFALNPEEKQALIENEKAWKTSQHRQILR